MIKRTAFYEIHTSLGARMMEFGGFEMPVQYTGIMEEHRAVRTNAGVFDVSHMGEFRVRGRDAAAFLQHMTINDVTKLSSGRAHYTAMCYDDGGIVDDLLVYHCGDYYMLVVNAANIEKDFEWLKSHLRSDVELNDVSDSISLLAVQGPSSLKTLQKIADIDLSKIKYYHFAWGKIAGIPCIISRTGYTGEIGFELYFDSSPASARTIWDAVFDAGTEYGIMPVGLGARDTLRLEMGFCLYGNDIDQTTNPLEAGLGWITKLEKGDFIGRNALLAVTGGGLKRRLIGFVLSEKLVPRHGYAILSGGNRVGVVTSGTFSPTLRRPIGMGYVPVELSGRGTTIEIDVRGRVTPAEIVQLPFLKRQ
jgi:aminomethyltransferase